MRATLTLVGCAALLVAAWFVRREPPLEQVPARTESRDLEEPRDPALTLDTIEPPAEGREPLTAPIGARPSEPPSKRELPGKITGIVREPDGTPRRLASVRFVWDDRGRSREAHASTGPDGRFELAFEDAGARGDMLATVHRSVFAPALLCDVEAGTRGVELVLGPRDTFTIEVRDPEGRALSCGTPDVYWSLGGRRIKEHEIPGDPPSWGRPPAPVFVSAHPYGYTSGWFGPFEPSQFGSRLEITVERDPRVRGRVTRAGQPVERALVSLRPHPAPTDEQPGSPRRGVTGTWTERGAFEIPCRESGDFELVAFVVPHGEGRAGPVHLDGSHDVEGVAIELTRAPGAIEGRVLFPSGHGPEEIWLDVSGYGYRPLRRDGTFLLPDLPPGPCLVEILEGYGWKELRGEPGESWVSMTHGPTHGPSWLAYERVHWVEVPSGGRAHLEIDLASPLACELVGRVRIDGAAPKLRPADSWIDSTFGESRARFPSRDPWEEDSSSHLDDEGRFVLGVSEPGSRRLELELELVGAKEEQWIVQDRVELRHGHMEWSLDVATGSLLLLPPDEEHPLWSYFPALWQGPGELRIRVEYPELDEARGTRLYRRVPVGKVRLESGSGEAAVVLECEIRAGETTVLRWPQ